ncbi:lipopolysaccharide assembly protein LapB [Rufibacter sp. LB8]|uniref:tetratricopeptide repeat protein n=1 Tax=Rufibacter sp. LB8 TaxID=2777781 RepID=UPI00178C2146|nr:tetratricopeptide repeat protein [Rufibacter sp. LB8]
MEAMYQSRALLLIQQGKFDLAEKELRSALTQDIHNALNHAYLALCLANLKKFKEAQQEAQLAIAEEPDLAFAHYILSVIHFDEDRLKESEAAIKEALELDPEEAAFYHILGNIHFRRRAWQKALDAANLGLALDPEDVDCLNLQARALNRLGEKNLANQSFTNAFQHAPENHETHANQGWVYLEQNEHKLALQHFQEALRLDPTSEFAREGLLEALKAKYWVYRAFLQFSFKISSISGAARWALFIGVYVLVRVMPLLLPFYLMLVFFSWFSDLIFNTLLRFNRYGRMVLNQEEIKGSNLFLALFLGGISALAVNKIFRIEEAIPIGVVLLGMLFPVAGTLQLSNKKSRKKSFYVASAIGVLGAVAILAAFVNPELGSTLLSGFYISALLYTWFRMSLS